MSFDRSRKIPAVLNGGMRINYGGANPPRNGGCTKLLTGIIVLDWYKKAASVLPQFWMLSKISVIITQSSHTGQLGATNSDLPVGTAGMYQGSLT